jgi:uncharacterized protein YuzE
MKISYNLETDSVYIRLLEGKYECRTLRLNEDVALNIGPNEALVGIEILDVQQMFGEKGIPSVFLENIKIAQIAQM